MHANFARLWFPIHESVREFAFGIYRRIKTLAARAKATFQRARTRSNINRFDAMRRRRRRRRAAMRKQRVVQLQTARPGHHRPRCRRHHRRRQSGLRCLFHFQTHATLDSRPRAKSTIKRKTLQKSRAFSARNIKKICMRIAFIANAFNFFLCFSWRCSMCNKSKCTQEKNK